MSTHTYPVPGALRHAQMARQVTSAAQYWGPRFTLATIMIWAAGLLVGFQLSVIVLVLMGFAAAVLGIRYPSIGLMGIAVLVAVDGPARTEIFTGGILRYNLFNYWLLVVMALSIPFLVRLKDPHSRLLQALVLLLGLQLVGTSNLVGGANSLLNLATVFGLLVYFAAVGHDRSTYYWAGVVAATVAATGGLMSILLHGGQPPGNPNNWAILPLTGLLSVCLGFPVAVAGSRGRLTLGLLAILNLAVLNVTWVFLSASRGVSLIALVSVAYLILAIRGMPRRMAIFLVGASMALAVGTQFPELQARLRERVAQSFDPAYEISTRTSGRSDLMLAGWHMFKRSPFGVGTGGFASAWASLGDLRGELAFDRRIGLETQAHAGWIKILAENGIVGFLLLAAYVASFTFIGLRKSGENKDLRLLGIMVSGVLLVAFTAREFYDKGLWFLAAGATALLHGLDLRTRPAAKVYSPISERSDVVPRPPA